MLSQFEDEKDEDKESEQKEIFGDYDFLKNFAHAFLDGEIGGTPLEGSHLAVNMHFLKEFLDSLNDEPKDELDKIIQHLAKSSFSETTLSNLNKLRQDLSVCAKLDADINKMINDIKNIPHLTSGNIDEIVEEKIKNLSEKIYTKMQKNGYVYFPGGWAGSSGHQMMYYLKEDELHVYNTGAGIQYHGSVPRSSGKKGYYPVYGIKFPVNQASVIELIGRLLKPQILPQFNRSYKPDDKTIYEKILLSSIIWMKATRIPGEDLGKPKLGQRSGVCVYKAMTLIEKQSFAEKHQFRQYIFAKRLKFLKYAMSPENLNRISQQIIDYPARIEEGRANTSRMLDKQIKPYIKNWNLNKDQIAIIRDHLSTWKEVLQAMPVKPLDRVVIKKPDEDAEPITLVSDYDANIEIGGVEVETKPTKILELLPESILKSLQNTNDIPRLTLNDIERFCFIFTDPSARSTPTINEMTDATRDMLLMSLGKILFDLFTQRQKLSPRSIVLYFSFMMIIDNLSQSGLFAIGDKQLLGIPDFYRKTINDFIQKASQNSVFATFDPILDALWNRVLKYYSQFSQAEAKESDDSQIWIKYYCDIIKASPENEIKTIKDMWENTDSKQIDIDKNIKGLLKEGDYFCFSYLGRETRAAFNKTTPILNQAFKMQLFIERFYQSCLARICGYGEVTLDAMFNDASLGTMKRIEYFYNLNKAIIEMGLSGKYNLAQIIMKRDNIQINKYYFKENFYFKETAIKNALSTKLSGKFYNSHTIPSLTPGTLLKEGFEHSFSFKAPSIHLLKSRTEEARNEGLLHYLQLIPESQFVAHLTELKYRPNWLKESEYQRYIELSLFQPGIVLNTLQFNPEAILKLNDLMSYYHQTNDPAYSETAEWFLLRLAIKISLYGIKAEAAKLITLPDHVRKQLIQWQENMLKAIQLRLSSLNSPNEQKNLYYLKISILNARAQQSESDSAELFKAYFICSLLPKDSKFNLVSEERIASLLDASAITLCDLIKDNKINIKSILPNILAELQKLDPDNLIWKIQWQYHHTPAISHTIQLVDDSEKVFEFDLIQQQMRINDYNLSYPPLNMLMSPEYREIFGNHQQVAVVANTYFRNSGACYLYQFNYQGIDWSCLFPIKKEDSDKVKVARAFDGNRYFLAAPTLSMVKSLMARDFGFALHYYRLFEQARFRMWLADGDDYFIEDRNTKQIAYRFLRGELKKCIEPQGIVNLSAVIPDTLLRLEYNDFIECIEQSDGKIIWHLPRYHLSFKEDKSTNLLFTLDDRYQLMIPYKEKDTFGTGVILKAINKDEPDVYLMPLQRYYLYEAKDKKPLSYNYYAHDLSNFLADDELEVANKRTKSNDSQKPFLGWDFEGTEKFIRFTLSGDQINAGLSTTVDQIYLAYLYIIQDKAQLAFEILSRCQFQGTAEEIERLWWLLTQLPAKSDKQLQNSKIVAVQMIALHAMLVMKTQSPELVNQFTNLHLPESSTKEVRIHLRKSVAKYFANLHAHVKDHYILYDNIRNNIPAKLRLSGGQENIVLSYCVNQFKLDFVTRKVNEREPLEALGARYYMKFPNEDKSISKSIYVNMISTLEPVVIAENVMIWLSLLKEMDTSLSYMLEKQLPIASDVALNSLSPGMDVQFLFRHFSTYYEMARNADDENTKDKMFRFCYACVSAYSDFEKSEDNAFRLAAEILISVMAYSEKFPKKYVDLILITDNKKSDSPDREKIIKKLASCSTPIEFKMLRYKGEGLALGIPAPKSQAKLVEQADVSEENEFKSSSPFEGTIFDTLAKALETEETLLEKRFMATIGESKGVEDLTLEEQDDLLTTLDKKLLDIKIQVEDEQVKLYKQHQDQCKQEISKLNDAIKNLTKIQQQVETRVNELLSNRDKEVYLIKELGNQEETPNLQYLLKNYAKSTTRDLKAMGIVDEKIPLLQADLQEYLIVSDTIKRLTILIDELKKENITGIVTALLSKNQATNKQQAIFQYIEDIALRPSQAKLLKLIVSLNNPKLLMNSKVMQAMMGDGKTKVLMVITSMLFADGKHLPINVYPPTSLNTNFSDHRGVAKKVFNQDGFLFNFNRDTSCTVPELTYLFERMSIAIKHKEFMATTPNDIKSLALKFIELMYRLNMSEEKLEPKQIKLLESQIHWICKIIGLIAESGIASVDEAHMLLQIMYELNYSIGKPVPINKIISQFTVELYTQLLDIEIPASITGDHSITFSQLLIKPDVLIKGKRFPELMGFYIDYFTNPKTQPDWIKDFLVANLTVDDLRKFLTSTRDDNNDNEIKQKLEAKYPEIYYKWLLLRAEFTLLLPYTLAKKLDHKHGEDVIRNTPFSISYAANKVPTPNVFASFMETFNLTSQKDFVKGVRKQDFISTMRQWHNLANLFEPIDIDDVSPYEVIFNKIFVNTGYALKSINLDNPEIMDAMYKLAYKNTDMIVYILLENLSKLTLDPYILRHDSLNFAGMFFSVLAFSASPDNFRTFHQDIEMVFENTFLIFSQIEHYLRTKNTDIIESKANTFDPEINARIVLQQAVGASADFSMFIDCGVQLLGVSTIQTVPIFESLKQQMPGIQYVLFYQGSSLYSWDLSKSDPNQLPQLLTSTNADTIQNELKCTPDKRITLLDEEHTTGIDIRQKPNGVGIVTVDFNTTSTQFYQAVARMRDLKNLQSIIIIVAPGLYKLLDPAGRLESLFTRMRNNFRAEQEPQNFQSALMKLRNLYRQDLDSRMRKASTQELKNKIFMNGFTFFLEAQHDNISVLYGARDSLLDTDKILKNYALKQRNLWKEAMDACFPPDEVDAADKILDAVSVKIQNKHVKICKQKQAYPVAEMGKSMQLQKEQEKKTEISAQKQKQMEKKNDVSDASVSPNPFQYKWIADLEKKPDNLSAIFEQHKKLVSLLPEYKIDWKADNLYASPNYLYFYQTQPTNEIYRLESQPSIHLMFTIINNKLSAVFIAPEEMKRLFPVLNNPKNDLQSRCWITAIDGDPITKPPTLTDDLLQQRNTLLEQATFFGGRPDILVLQKRLAWVNEQKEMKLEFFQKEIMPMLGVSKEHVMLLTNALYNITAFINAWANPENDYAQTENWRQKEFPPAIRKRFDKIFPLLDELRSSALVQSKPFTYEQITKKNILSVDANAILAYQAELSARNDYKDCALYIMKNPKVRFSYFMNACLDNITHCYDKALRVLNEMSSINQAHKWREKLFKAMVLHPDEVTAHKELLKQVLQYLEQIDILHGIDFAQLFPLRKCEILLSLAKGNIKDHDIVSTVLQDTGYAKVIASQLNNKMDEAAIKNDAMVYRTKKIDEYFRIPILRLSDKPKNMQEAIFHLANLKYPCPPVKLMFLMVNYPQFSDIINLLSNRNKLTKEFFDSLITILSIPNQFLKPDASDILVIVKHHLDYLNTRLLIDKVDLAVLLETKGTWEALRVLEEAKSDTQDNLIKIFANPTCSSAVSIVGHCYSAITHHEMSQFLLQSDEIIQNVSYYLTYLKSIGLPVTKDIFKALHQKEYCDYLDRMQAVGVSNPETVAKVFRQPELLTSLRLVSQLNVQDEKTNLDYHIRAIEEPQLLQAMLLLHANTLNETALISKILTSDLLKQLFSLCYQESKAPHLVPKKIIQCIKELLKLEAAYLADPNFVNVKDSFANFTISAIQTLLLCDAQIENNKNNQKVLAKSLYQLSEKMPENKKGCNQLVSALLKNVGLSEFIETSIFSFFSGSSSSPPTPQSQPVKKTGPNQDRR